MKETPDVVTNMLKVFNFCEYALLHPHFNLCFVNPFLVTKFVMSP